ncbi:MAG TPA: hypothetical protein VH277_12880 [Gemmatimonadaceae bacterium]|nr:hypothetical protein [Gemmatimonadaceae bacterium]
MTTGFLRTSASRRIAAVLTALAGFMAFNLFDNVFGVGNAIAGLVVWSALTVFVFRRSPPLSEERDA